MTEQKFEVVKIRYSKFFFSKFAFITAFVVFFHVLLLRVCKNAQSEELVKFNSNRNPAIVWYHIPSKEHNLWWHPTTPTVHCITAANTTVACDLLKKQDQHDNCEGFIFYGTFVTYLPLPRDPKVIWGVIHEESPRNCGLFMFEKGLNLFNFSSTFSRYSDIPFPLTYIKQEDITSKAMWVQTTTKNKLLKDLAPVLYIQSNPDSMNDRDEYVKELMKYIPIDCMGRSLFNKKWPNDNHVGLTPDKREYLGMLETKEFMNLTSRYKFVLAIETGVCNDYTTEKLWRPISQGVVPIYFGSPLVRDWLPNEKTAILIEDFRTPALLAEYLHRLLRNDTLYEEHLEHKTKGLISNSKLIEELEKHPFQSNFINNLNKLFCVMCERIHENSSRVNIVTKKHYDCNVEPRSLLTGKVNETNRWHKVLQDAKESIDILYEKLVYNFSVPLTKKGYLWTKNRNLFLNNDYRNE